MARNRNQTVQPQEPVFDLSFCDTSTEVVKTAKKTAAECINNDTRGLGANFTSLRRNRTETQAAIEEHGKLDKDALHEILNVGNFNLFRHFMTDKEKERKMFTGNQCLNILFRAAGTDKKAKAMREEFFAAQ